MSWSCQGKSGRFGGLAASVMEYVILLVKINIIRYFIRLANSRLFYLYLYSSFIFFLL
jgi:hypothetical protein